MTTDTTDAAPTWAALDTQLWDIDRVIPYAKNSRKHSAAQVSQIAAAIRHWGFTIPLLVDEGGSLIAGHARLLAAKELNLAKVPVAIAKGWSDEQKRAYVIADNRLAEASSWDSANLLSELSSLTSSDFALDLMGFTNKQFEKLMKAAEIDLDALAAKAKEQQATETRSTVTCPQCTHTFFVE